MSLGGGSGGDGGAAQQQAEEARKASMRTQINSLFDAPDAQAQFKTQEDQLSEALRGFYSDQLGRSYADAERGARFGAADTGNIGGSAYADSLARVNRDNALGGTRIQEAVTRAINNLRASREDTRNRSIGLVNSGSGDQAAASAQSGLQQAISAANAAQRENIVGDLFGDVAFAKQASDTNLKNQELARRASAFYPTQPSSGGTVIKY